MLFAASAVGVSHLIQSTRAGAAFGSGMVLVIILICLVKYPFFLFGAHYTAVTGNTIIEGYRKLGRWLLFVIFCVYVFELPFAIAGISVVAAGILISSLDLQANDRLVALVLVTSCLAFTALGRYRFLERASRVLVLLFVTCIIVGTGVTVASNINHYSLSLQPMAPIRENLLFLVALAGWMPTGVGGALGISLWIHAKNQRIGRNLSLKEVRFDFNFSYAIVVLTAVCFSLLGTYALTSGLHELEGSSIEFADRLFAIFMGSFPAWLHVVMIVGANVVMLSSLPVVVDLLPRLGTTLLASLGLTGQDKTDSSRVYLAFVVYELASVSLVLLMSTGPFTSFIDLVTSLGFLAAPIIAFLNHKVMFSGDLDADRQPSRFLRYWSVAAICLLSVISLFYITSLVIA